ncbi:MT-A70-domain-containing protein [Hypomontagnella monticulosa]|nr:MT-A70-domain-containing protein [Hypomontagnella monticulosa]
MADPHHESVSCVLFESSDRSTILIDIPRSIEEAQVSPGQAIKRRIISSTPIKTPWETPDPKNKDPAQLATPSAAVAELMTLESVKIALEEIKHNYEGPWCLPRVLKDTSTSNTDKLSLEMTRKRKQRSPDSEMSNVAQDPFIPDRSHYLLGTIESQRRNFLTDAPMFDLMVLDPPWPSRSVKRKRDGYTVVYGMQEARSLLSQIPVSSHLKPDGLVAVWVTNRATVTELLTSPGGIFSEWGLEPVGEWIWLKITSSGEPVINIESQWRRPWERLLLGRRKGGTVTTPIPTKVIMGVPDIHSRKPNLRSLFQDILPEDYSGLEVFARNLITGWWSWGNEVLYFQQGNHWVDIEVK